MADTNTVAIITEFGARRAIALAICLLLLSAARSDTPALVDQRAVVSLAFTNFLDRVEPGHFIAARLTTPSRRSKHVETAYMQAGLLMESYTQPPLDVYGPTYSTYVLSRKSTR